jgi:hypothetical protein
LFSAELEDRKKKDDRKVERELKKKRSKDVHNRKCEDAEVDLEQGNNPQDSCNQGPQNAKVPKLSLETLKNNPNSFASTMIPEGSDCEADDIDLEMNEDDDSDAEDDEIDVAKCKSTETVGTDFSVRSGEGANTSEKGVVEDVGFVPPDPISPLARKLIPVFLLAFLFCLWYFVMPQ